MYEVKVKNGEVVVPEPMKRAIMKLQEFQITKQEMANEEELIKDALYKAMKEAGIKTWEYPGFAKYTVVEPTTQKRIDKKLIISAGLDPDDFSVTTEKKGFLKITYDD